MPEGHVIHALANRLNALFAENAVRVSSPQGRFAVAAERLDATHLLQAEANGKQLFLDFDLPEPATVHIHLGLVGKLRVQPLAPPVGMVRLRIANDEFAADLHGPQWCRMITRAERATAMKGIGPDPLRADADPAKGWALVRRSARPIAELLLDQRIAAGVGNIYRAEVLFRQRINPQAPGSGLRRRTWHAIWDDLVALLAAGVASGRIDTVRAEHAPEVSGRRPRDDPHGGEVYVYRRQGRPCLVCGSEVRGRAQSGRNLFWCARCQRRTS